MSLGGNLQVGKSQITYGIQDASQATKEAANQCRSQSSNINSTYEDQLQTLELDDNSQQIVSDIEAKNMEISEKEMDVEDKTQTQTENEEKITQNDTMIAALDATIANCDSQISSLNSQISSLEGQMSSISEGSSSEEKQAAATQKQQLQGQIANLKTQVQQFETQKTQAEQDKKTLEDKKSQIEKENSTLQKEIDDIQQEIANLNDEITQLSQKLEEANKNNEEIAQLNQARDAALSTIEGAASEIEAQAEKNEEEKKNKEDEEGFNYSDLNGDLISLGQFQSLEADVSKIDELNKKLKNMGINSQINILDGISVAEANLILGLNKDSVFGENDKYSQKELDYLIGELGIDAKVSADDSSYVLSREGFKTGVQTKNKDNGKDNQTKVWQLYSKDGMITESSADYIGTGNQLDTQVSNKYSYNKDENKLMVEHSRADHISNQGDMTNTYSSVELSLDENEAKEATTNYTSIVNKGTYIDKRKEVKESIDNLENPKGQTKANKVYDEIVKSDKSNEEKLQDISKLEKDIEKGKYD